MIAAPCLLRYYCAPQLRRAAEGLARHGVEATVERRHAVKTVLGLLASVLFVAATMANGEETAVTNNQATAKTTAVTMSTSLGDITIELYPDKAPVTVSNFLAYVDAKFYDGTIFHRVIPDFMVQGGGFDESMRQKATRSPIKNEANNGLKNDRGTIAMARTMVVDSATAQFFINVKNNDFLNHGGRDFGYAVFARVTAGMDIVDKIAAVPTANDVPVTPVVIRSVKRKP